MGAARLAVVALAAGCGPTPCDSPVTSGASEAGEGVLDALHHVVGAPAAAVARLEALQTEPWVGVVGCADPEAPAEPALKLGFRVGNASQLAVALAVLTGVDADAVDLDVPRSDLVPNHGASRPPTLRELLSHTAGVPDYSVQEAFLAEPDRAWSRDALLDLADAAEPVHDAGAGFATSSTHALVVDAWLEGLTGRDVATTFADDVAGPLGLSATAFTHAAEASGPLAIPSREGCAGLLCDVSEVDTPSPAALQAAGSLVGPAGELVHLAAATTAATLLSEAARAELDPAIATDGAWEAAGFERVGLGVFERDLGGSPALVHTSSLAGVASLLVSIPARGESWVLVAARQLDTEDLVDALEEGL